MSQEDMAMVQNLWHGCELHKQGHPSIYNIKYRKVTEVNKEMKIRKCEIGSPDGGYCAEKVIMFVGETGTGKTSTINTVVNYLLGVQWDHAERYRLVLDEDERKETTQTASQTKWITSYTIHQTKRTNGRVTLVDTPGYGHTEGKEADEAITSQVREFFSTRGEGGIDHIDAIAFVVKASSLRLSEGQEYIYNSVFRLFGENIADNVFVFITHVQATDMLGEEKKIPVMEAIKKAKINPRGYLLCDNLAQFYQRVQQSKPTGKKLVLDEMNMALWMTIEENLGTFFNDLDNCLPRSIVLSAEVLKERQELEIIVAGMHDLVRSRIVELKRLGNEAVALETYVQEINNNQDFSYEVVENNIEEIELEGGERATVCHTCQITCHYPCKRDVFMKLGVKMCEAIKASKCVVCNCMSDVHEMVSKKYILNAVTVTKTNPFKKEKHNAAKRELRSREDALNDIIEKQKQLNDEIMACAKKVQKCLQRLGEISLRPNPRLILQELKALQDKEMTKQEPQWEDRVTELKRIYREFEKDIEDNYEAMMTPL